MEGERLDEVAMTTDEEALNAWWRHAMPKDEIGATAFLKEHPTYDGRGVVVAIFDTGVDPGAAGLQSTPHGEPKVLDVLDCTGSGDVDVSKVVKASDDGVTIEGTTGRKLRVNPSWSNPSGKWHVGHKQLFELFPGPLKRRMSQHRRKSWDEQQRRAVAQEHAALAAFNREHPAAALTEPGGEMAKQRDELQARVDLLKDLQDGYKDEGPVVDCVVWHDGERWRAALDCQDLYDPGSGQGLLADMTPMTNFKDERQYGTFSPVDACNYALNIYESGNVLSIVVDSGSHGTHVAGITAAYHPEDAALNGIAPGAQIISCKIGDSRLGGMETGVGLTRAVVAVLDHKADLVNMSYGEPTSTPNEGRFIELADMLVKKYGVIFVSSAGNSGPALTTVGAPGGTSSSIFSIGAYVSPELALAGHSHQDSSLQGQQYTWSSRGPTADGALGVTFCAPGGAVAPVPQWSRQARMLMNGTSMASPNACGGIALLLSALKQDAARAGHSSPARLRRTIENTAWLPGSGRPDEPLTFGAGLLQVQEAWKYLRRSKDADQPDVQYTIRVVRSDNGGAPGRGIYLREVEDLVGPVRFRVEIGTALHEDADVCSELLAVEDKLALRTDAPWVHAPPHCLLPHNGRSFDVTVDASQLPEGLHYAEIVALDSTREWRGPLARVPITVIKPMQLPRSPQPAAPTGDASEARSGEDAHWSSVALGALRFEGGAEVRRFVAVPEGATWAEAHFRAGLHASTKLYFVEAKQLLPRCRPSEAAVAKRFTLPAGGHESMLLPVVEGTTLELAVGQYWLSTGPSTVDVTIHFHGLKPTLLPPPPAASAASGGAGAGAVVLDGAAAPQRLVVRAPLRRERAAPAAKLTALRLPLRPAEAVLEPLVADERDHLPEGRLIHRLILTYKFTLAEGGKITPRIPMLNHQVYDGEFEAQLTMLFDDKKRLLSVGDIYPETVEVGKGDFVLRVLLRHDQVDLLDKLKAMPLLLERTLSPSVSAPVYATLRNAVKGGPTAKERTLAQGEAATYWIGPPADDKLPKDAKPGCLLVGTLALAKPQAGGGSGGGGDKPSVAGLPFSYLVPPTAKEDSKSGGGGSKAEAGAEQSAEEKLKEALRDAQVKILKEMKLGDTGGEAAQAGSAESAALEVYSSLLKQLREQWPDHLQLLREPLDRMWALEGSQRAASMDGIILAADEVVAAVDQVELAKWVAAKSPAEGPAAVRKKKQMEEARTALVDALSRKASAMLEREGSGSEAEAAGRDVIRQPLPEEDEFEEVFQTLRRWADTTEAAHVGLHVRREARYARIGTAVKVLNKALAADEKPASVKKLAKLRIDLFKRLGWMHWARHAEAQLLSHYPEQYPLL